MVLSALVYPGTGQLMQRRWAAGIGFAFVFTIGFVWFVVEIVGVLNAYYAFAVDFKGATGKAPGVGAILLPLALSTMIYIAGLIDTAVASYRMRPTRGSSISS
jgi:hypothetical protein